MRTTRAAAAVARLNARDVQNTYSLAMTSDGQFRLVRTNEDDVQEALGDALPLDEFVRFVDATGPQKPVRVSKLDVAFERQLARKKE